MFKVSILLYTSIICKIDSNSQIFNVSKISSCIFSNTSEQREDSRGKDKRAVFKWQQHGISSSPWSGLNMLL